MARGGASAHRKPFPLYTTLTPEEKARIGFRPDAPAPGSARAGRPRLLKEHRFPVSYPDGGRGECFYERLGPACHRFGYEYRGREAEREDGTGDDGRHDRPGEVIPFPRQWVTEPLANTPAQIEEKGRQLAPAAFSEAVERERREYFARAGEGFGRVRNPALARISARRAKALGGRYALCHRTAGGALIPAGDATYATLAEANAAWEAQAGRERGLVVGCCNRLDRCWQMPRLNPLYAAFDPWAPGGTPDRESSGATKGGEPAETGAG